MGNDPYVAIVSIRLTKDYVEALDVECSKDRRSRSDWIRIKLEEFLTRSETGISTSTGRDGLPLD